jgi:cysteine desulfurase
MIYLDYNATTPCDPAVLEVMLPYFSEHFGNAASRTHPYGWVADEAVKKAREQVATLIGAESAEIIFTSGATESCNLAIKGIFENYTSKGNHIITCGTEHKAVLDTCTHLEKLGAVVTRLPVNQHGLPDLEELERVITPNTILIALMYANNETGVILPVDAIGNIAQKHGIIFFCDATQAAGKIPINVQQSQIGMLALSAHKLYGPKGTGALYIRRKNPRVKPKAQMDGGGHEGGFRSGTLNVSGIVGMGAACALAASKMQSEAIRLAALRDRLEKGLKHLHEITTNGAGASRLPHVSNISFLGLKAERLIALLNSEIAFSVGSACTAASQQPSHVLEAMGMDKKVIDGSVRLSLGRFTTEEEIDRTLLAFQAAIIDLKK